MNSSWRKRLIFLRDAYTSTAVIISFQSGHFLLALAGRCFNFRMHAHEFLA